MGVIGALIWHCVLHGCCRVVYISLCIAWVLSCCWSLMVYSMSLSVCWYMIVYGMGCIALVIYHCVLHGLYRVAGISLCVVWV